MSKMNDADALIEHRKDLVALGHTEEEAKTITYGEAYGASAQTIEKMVPSLFPRELTEDELIYVQQIAMDLDWEYLNDNALYLRRNRRGNVSVEVPTMSGQSMNAWGEMCVRMAAALTYTSDYGDVMRAEPKDDGSGGLVVQLGNPHNEPILKDGWEKQ